MWLGFRPDGLNIFFLVSAVAVPVGESMSGSRLIELSVALEALLFLKAPLPLLLKKPGNSS